MVYKKYIWKNGKKMGPYYYESYRDGDKIRSRYIGTELPRDSKNNINKEVDKADSPFALRKILLISSFVLLMIFFLGGYLTFLGLSGNVILNVNEQYNINEVLEGSLSLAIEPGDVLSKDLDVSLALSRNNEIVVQSQEKLYEFLGNQASYEEINSTTEACVPIIEQVCSNVTETRENCPKTLMERVCSNVTEEREVCSMVENESVCANETATSEVCSDTSECESVNETREVCENNTIGEQCTNSSSSGYYYTTAGIYSRQISDFISYTLTETGTYKLTFEIPGLNLAAEKMIEVVDSAGNNIINETINETINPNAAENITANYTKGLTEKYIMSAGNTIDFASPTPANNTFTSNSSAIINVNVTESNLARFKFNWNGTNYTFYDENLVLMLNLNNKSALGENSTFVVDASRYANNGTVSGAVWNSSGKYGGGYKFNGVNNFMNFSNPSNLQITGNQITLSAWIYRTSNELASNSMCVIVKDDIANRDYDLCASNNSGTGAICGVFIGNTPYIVRTTGSLPLNRWLNILCTYNGSEIQYWVNGVLNNTLTGVSGNIDNDPANVVIGAFSEAATHWFNGTIDEVRILNRSLNSDEIREQYYSNLQKYDVGKWAAYVNQSLTPGSYNYFAAAADNSGNENQTETRQLTSSNNISFSQSVYSFNVSRAQNVVRLVVFNGLGNVQNVSANVTSVSPSLDTIQFLGTGTFDTPFIINSGESVNLTLGAIFDSANLLNYTVNVSLYNQSLTELSRAQVILNLPALNRYSFNSSTNSLTFSLTDVNDVNAICSDSRKSFVIVNNGSEPISDLRANVTGNLEVYMYPNLNGYNLDAGGNVTVYVRVIANETTATNTGTINISSAVGLSRLVDISYTSPGTTWGVSTGTSGTRLYSAHSDSFICVNHRSYAVDLNFPGAVAQNPILSAGYVGTFENRCNSIQAHDTYFYMNGNQFLSILKTNYLDDYPGVPLGTVRSNVNPVYIQQNNTLLVTSENYQLGGHFCANTYNTLNVVVNLSDTNNTRYSTSYCDLCNQTETSESNFTDGADSDCDGAIDCADLDSCSSSVCSGQNTLICPTLETGTLCNDGIDNDNNGLVDCEQTQTCCGIGACSNSPGCRGVTGFFVDSCKVLNAPGIYYLQGDVHANGTCFNITASGVQLRKGASTVYYGESGSGYGVLISNGASDVLVKDMILIKNGSAGNNNIGIYVSNYSSQNVYLVNNTIRPNGTGTDDGIRIKSGDKRFILNNTIILTSSGDFASSRGIYFEQSTLEDTRKNVTNTFVEGNDITTGFGRYGDGIDLSVIGFSNLSISKNTIRLYGDYSNGIVPCSMSCNLYEFVNITNNNIFAFEHDNTGVTTKVQGAGVERNVIVSYNNVTLNSTSSTGILSPLNNGIFSFNNVSSSSGAGIAIIKSVTIGNMPNNNSIFNNTVSSQGNYGIYDAGTNSSIYNNFVNNGSGGIWSVPDTTYSRDTGFVINNTITNISGTGIFTGSYKKIYKNFITSSISGSWVVRAGDSSNVSNNNITSREGTITCGTNCSVDRNYVINSSINTGPAFGNDGSNITNNVMLSTAGTGGIFSSGDQTTIFNNLINFSLGNNDYGISCGSNCNISNNNITLNGTDIRGIYCTNNNILFGNNLLLSPGSFGSARGMDLNSGNIVQNNNITVVSGNPSPSFTEWAEGIQIYSINNTVTNNFIFMNGSTGLMGVGDAYDGNPENCTVSSNTILINEQQATSVEGYGGIALGTSWNSFSSNHLTIYNNTIIVNNSVWGYSKAIELGGLINANVSDNRISGYSNGTIYGIWMNDVQDSDFNGNNITVNGSGTLPWAACIEVYGIYGSTDTDSGTYNFNNVNSYSFGSGFCANNSQGVSLRGDNTLNQDRIDASGYEIGATLFSNDCLNLTNIMLSSQTNLSSSCIRINSATAIIGVNSTPPSLPSWTRSTYDFLNFESSGFPPINSSFNFSYTNSEANFFEDTLRIYRYNYTSLEWDVLPQSTVDVANNNVYSGNISEFSLFGALGDVVKLENLQCELNGSVFANCSSAHYRYNITQVRANCTAYNMSVMNVTFNLTNVYDNTNFIVGVTTANTTGWFVLNNSDVEIIDSGNWSLSATCYASNGTDNFYRSNSEGFGIPFGNITSAVITAPSGNADVTKDIAFDLNTSISCAGGECVNVSVTLDPEKQTNSLPSCSGYSDSVSCPAAHENCYWMWIDMEMGMGICLSSETLCNNLGDDDSDTFTDCDDSDCADASNCVIPDIDGDGVPDSTDTLTGNSSNVTSTGISNLNVTFNGIQNSNPSGVQTVAFSNGSTVLFEFSFDFGSGTLDLTSVNITKRRDEIYVDGLNGISKTILIPIGLGKGVCVKNTNGVILSLLSCSGTDEYLITPAACDGDFVSIGGDSVNCTVSGSNYAVSGLTHSGGGPYSKGVMPMSAGTPFYTTSQNPRDWTTDSCLISIKSGETCNSSWRVVPTGTAGDSWEFFATYTGSSLDTNKINITIVAASTTPSTGGGGGGGGCTPSYDRCSQIGECINNRAQWDCEDVNGCHVPNVTVTSNCVTECDSVYNDCTAWSACDKGKSKRNCTDISCGTGTIEFTRECEMPVCAPNWTCSDWSGCFDNKITRTCNDLNECHINLERPAELMDCGCSSNYMCGDWSACTYEESLSNLFAGNLNLFGKQSRNCVDINRCGKNYTVYSNCTTGFNITIAREDICGEDSLLVSGLENNKPLSIISLDTLRNNKLDVSFIQSRTQYCSTCYNGVRDGDELGIDCGGSCLGCMKEAYSLLWLIILLLIIIECLIARYFYKNRDYVQLDYYMFQDDFRAYKALKKREFREWYRNSKFTRIFGRSVT